MASIKLVDNLKFGLQWAIQNDLKLTGVKPFKNDFDLSGPLEFASTISGPSLTFTASDIAGNTKLLIQALAENNKAKVLSAPHILVSDNREARIQVGDQVPIATSVTTYSGTTSSGSSTTTSNPTTYTVQYKDTGTILKVKPQINDSGLISLEVSQEVSSVARQTVLGTEQYVVSKKEVTTSLVAQDGQTIVIGGLIDETTSKGRAGLPFLSKIPLLGYLFGSTTDETTRTELIILLTPYVVRSQAEAGNMSSGYIKRLKGVDREVEELRIKKDERQKK